MNYLLQPADNINENERKNDLVKPGADQRWGGGHFGKVPGALQIYGASRFFRAPCFSERRPHCNYFGGTYHIM